MAAEKKPWYTIKMEGDTPEISINGYIGNEEGDTNYQSFIDSLNGLKLKGFKKVNMNINCGGGDMFNGFAIHDAGKNCGMKINCTVIGMAASMGSVLMLMGDKKPLIHKNAFVMTHEPQAGEYGTSADLRAMADLADKMKDRVVKLYASITGKPEAEVADWVKPEAKWFSAEDAVAAGLCRGTTNDGGLVEAAPDVTNKKPKEIWAVYNKVLDNTITDTKPNTMIFNKLTAKQLQLKESQEYTDAEVALAINALNKRAIDAEAKLEELEESQKAEKEERATKLVNAAIKAKKITAEDKDSLIEMAISKYDMVEKMLGMKPASGNIINKLRVDDSGTDTKDEDALEEVTMSAAEKAIVDGEKPYSELARYKGGKLLAKIKKEAPNLFKDIYFRTYNKMP